MNILIIGINYTPELIANAVYTSGLANWLSKRNHDIKMVTAVPYYPAWKVFDGYPKFRYVNVITPEGVRVTHCPLYVPANPTGKKRILHHASFAMSALPVALFHSIRRRPDLVLVVAPSLMSAPVGWLASKFGRAKAWLHIQDFEVEAAFATGLLPSTGFIASAARAFEKWCLKRFDLVSSISVPMIQKLTDHGLPDDKKFEFRNWADLAQVTPLDEAPALKTELGITTPYVALYSGNIANKQGLEVIPEAARVLKDRQDLTFAVFGDGPALADLKKRAQGLENIKFFPLQPKEKLGELLGIADVHLLPQIAGAADLVLPSKLTNMLASGRPVIATAEEGTALADEVVGAGVITPPADPNSLADAISTLINDDNLRKELGIAARMRAVDRWDGESILQRLEARLLDLIDDNNTGARPTTYPEKNDL